MKVAISSKDLASLKHEHWRLRAISCEDRVLQEAITSLIAILGNFCNSCSGSGETLIGRECPDCGGTGDRE